MNNKVFSIFASILFVCAIIGCTQVMEVPEYNLAKISTCPDSKGNEAYYILYGIIEEDRSSRENDINEYYFLLSLAESPDSIIMRVEASRISYTGKVDSCVARVGGLLPGVAYDYYFCVANNGNVLNGEKSSFSSFIKDEIFSVVPEGVDLGLRTIWASHNVGATTPEGIGGRYAWGEIEEKDSYTVENYKYYLGDLDGDGDYERNEFVDIGSNISQTEYDVAHVEWGNGWRMPTWLDIQKLYTNCSWEWVRVNGVCGQKVTGPNGNSIFLPATEPYYGYGSYWSSYSDSSFSDSYVGYCMFFDYIGNALSSKDEWGGWIWGCMCFDGLPIRPVKDKEKASTTIAEKVDLGLSVKWASHNVGATAPEEYGGYYAWGETEEKDTYTIENYKYHKSEGGYNYKDLGSNISGTSHDVARVTWGDSWRMPTLSEMQELCDRCSWHWTSINGVYGQKVTGPNGNSIFLPAAGSYEESMGVFHHGSYWTATWVEDDIIGTCWLSFYEMYYNCGHNGCFIGRQIRPVCD